MHNSNLLGASFRLNWIAKLEGGPMTKRLYYADSYLKEFTSTVLDQRPVDRGFAVILDQTAFYPDSGGQPHDTGTLDAAHVVNVMENDAGAVLHVLDREVLNSQISGRIDWARRFDHMQQHTGQHILSQAFLSVAKARTLSFHMGLEISTIDIELAQPSSSQMEEAQALATGVVFEDRPVHVLTADKDSLHSLGVRKESQREGEIRVIDVEGFDRSPCGGTHVRRTGEIGMVFISGFERYKGGTRVEFVAGRRALKTLQKDHELLKKLGRLHSAAPENLPELTGRLLQDRMALSRENEDLKDQLLEAEAGELLQNAAGAENLIVVRKIYTGRSLEILKTLARKLTARQDALAILGSADTGQLVVARSTNVSGNCNDAIKKIAAEMGGKGGGKPELAQAGGLPADSLDPWMRALEKCFL
jgi:alanyl-tRNA synthetase